MLRSAELRKRFARRPAVAFLTGDATPERVRATETGSVVGRTGVSHHGVGESEA